MKLIADHLLAGSRILFVRKKDPNINDDLRVRYARKLATLPHLHVDDHEGMMQVMDELTQLGNQIKALDPDDPCHAFLDNRTVLDFKEVKRIADSARRTEPRLDQFKAIRVGIESIAIFTEKILAEHVDKDSEFHPYRHNREERRLKLLAHSATRVRLSGIGNKYWANTTPLKELPVLRPPWDLAWFEGEIEHEDDRGGFIRYAVVMESTFDEVTQIGTSTCTPMLWAEGEEADAFWPPKVVKWGAAGEYLEESTNDHDDFHELVTSAFFAVTMMHAKNHVITQEKPPAALSKKHKKKHGRDLLSFYTLDVEPAIQTLKRDADVQDSEGRSGIKRAMHQCRGHFADYRKGKGLFGRLKGLYWISEHTKGSVEQGTIVKDYQPVEAKK